jgi:hypothetical protein
MATWQSIDTVNALSGPSAVGGVAGSPVQNRSTTAAGKYQCGIDEFIVPASAGPAIGDVLYWWPQMETTARIKSIEIYWTALGAGATFTVGKVDPNNSANTDPAHYIGLTDASLAGRAAISLNVGEQVGQDPLGDQSTGQTAPAFGNAKIIPTLTFLGAAPAASAIITMVLEYLSGT